MKTRIVGLWQSWWWLTMHAAAAAAGGCDAQDAVSLCDASGHEFARGLSNFDSKVGVAGGSQPARTSACKQCRRNCTHTRIAVLLPGSRTEIV